jgi:hypothetical protein
MKCRALILRGDFLTFAPFSNLLSALDRDEVIEVPASRIGPLYYRLHVHVSNAYTQQSRDVYDDRKHHLRVINSHGALTTELRTHISTIKKLAYIYM